MNGLLGDPQAPQMPGSGMAKMAADDIQLRPLWIQTQERMAMGEIPQMDYETWKRQIIQQLQQMQQPQQPAQQQPQTPQAQSLI